jgi:hypothetical protein
MARFETVSTSGVCEMLATAAILPCMAFGLEAPSGKRGSA